MRRTSRVAAVAASLSMQEADVRQRVASWRREPGCALSDSSVILADLARVTEIDREKLTKSDL